MSDKEYALGGYEDLEISTQILIRAALNRGIEVDVLDRVAQFLKLQKDGRTEYVKQATKTSRDSYITFLIMEDKSVTKQFLQSAGLRVPEGRTFDDPEVALQFCRSAPWGQLVIKPSTTNFGVGITVVESDKEFSVLEPAISLAFSHADRVLVEEFVEGEEYRFLVVDFDAIAVCKRLPANVVGDGRSTVLDLVEIKNRDPRRGVGHVTPLEKIQLGETELRVLQEEYGCGAELVPKNGEAIFLRRNSNISTGGDSIDCTDDVNRYYKDVAQKAAACVDAKICGVDLIIPNASAEGLYSILELNFNPVLYIHDYPYEGKNRRVGENILDALGF